MLPSRFTYHRAGSLDEALSLLGTHGEDAKVLAGGQSLIPMMKLRFANPEHLVDVNHVDGLEGLEERDGSLRIGALTRYRDVIASDLISSRYPTIARAAPQISDPLVRNLGTVGGSLAHADPAGDLGAVMLALGASVVLKSSGGEREVPISEFLVDTFMTSIEPDELLTEIRVPMPGERSGGDYLKLERKVGDWATVAVAVSLTLSNGSIGRAGIGLTGVGPKNIQATEAEAALAGAAPGRRGLRRGGTPRGGCGQPRVRRAGTRGVQAAHGRRVRAARARARARDGERGLRGRSMEIKVNVNGTERTADVEDRLLLVHLIREVYELTGTHIGCDTSNCGACTVLLDGIPVKSCTMFAAQADGREITTVEGLMEGAELHPVQAAFKEHHGLQCGFCTPGMMLVGAALIERNPDPSDDDVRWAISGNVCRCTGYMNIVKAIQAAAATKAGHAPAAVEAANA